MGVVMGHKLEDYYRFINGDFFNLGPMVSFVWKNDEHWSVEAVSKNLKQNFFYDVEPFLTHDLHYADIVHPSDIQKVLWEVQQASEKQLRTFVHQPYRIKNGYGEYRWVQDTTTLFYDETKTITHYVGYIIDITESEKNLLRAIDNEEKLRAAQALAHLGNWELDFVKNELYWSDEIYRLFELDKNKFKPSYEAFLDAIHPSDRDLVKKSYENSLKTKERYIVEHRLLMQDKRVKYVEEMGETFYDEFGNPLKSVGTI